MGAPPAAPAAAGPFGAGVGAAAAGRCDGLVSGGQGVEWGRRRVWVVSVLTSAPGEARDATATGATTGTRRVLRLHSRDLLGHRLAAAVLALERRLGSGAPCVLLFLLHGGDAGEKGTGGERGAIQISWQLKVAARGLRRRRTGRTAPPHSSRRTPSCPAPDSGFTFGPASEETNPKHETLVDLLVPSSVHDARWRSELVALQAEAAKEREEPET